MDAASSAAEGNEMTDITTRLRRWSISTDAVPASDLMDEAADRIESDAKQISVLIEECQKLKDLCVNGASLTAEERQALTWFTGGRGPVCPQNMAIIHSLMRRLP